IQYFFFQAEDGIRDFHVTGVQTCALPIWGTLLAARADDDRGCLTTARRRSRIGTEAFRTVRKDVYEHGRSTLVARVAAARRDGRSEERRVGKEGRERWER